MSAAPAIETAPKPLPGGLRLLLGAPTAAEFDAALAEFGAELAPTSMLETFLVEMILFAVRRLRRVQAAIAAAETDTPEHRRALTSAERSVWKAMGELQKARRPARSKAKPEPQPAVVPSEVPSPRPPVPGPATPARVASPPPPPRPRPRPTPDGVRRLERLLGGPSPRDLSALPTIAPTAGFVAAERT